MRLVHLLLLCVVLASCGDGGGRAHTIEHAREGMLLEDAIKAFGQPHEAKAALTLGPVVVWYQTARARCAGPAGHIDDCTALDGRAVGRWSLPGEDRQRPDLGVEERHFPTKCLAHYSQGIR